MHNAKRQFFNEIYAKYLPELKRFIGLRWPKEQDVDDLAHEAFLRLAQYPDLELIQNPRAFLFQTASNLAIDNYRQKQTRKCYFETEIEIQDISERESLSPDNVCENQHTLSHFTDLLNQLPELQRHAFVLYRLEDLSHAEIALRLGISVRSSERYVMQATQHLLSRKKMKNKNNGGQA